jgi:hypothetical protein
MASPPGHESGLSYGLAGQYMDSKIPNNTIYCLIHGKNTLFSEVELKKCNDIT